MTYLYISNNDVIFVGSDDYSSLHSSDGELLSSDGTLVDSDDDEEEIGEFNFRNTLLLAEALNLHQCAYSTEKQLL